MAATVTWKQIRSQFTQEDVDHMLTVTNDSLDLDKCETVKIWAHKIYERINADNMPPRPREPWTQEWKNNFKTWMDAGCNCT